MSHTHPDHPPKWADELLKLLCAESLLEEIQGDLHESFLRRAETKGIRFAKIHFIKESLLSLKPSNLKTYHSMDRYLILFKSHLKTGGRFLIKTWKYSIINIIGLSLGTMFSLFALMYTMDQMNYNKHLVGVKNLYKMGIESEMSGRQINFPGASHTMTEQIKEQVPEVKTLTRLRPEKAIIKQQDNTFSQEITIADRSLINILDLKFIQGSAHEFGSPDNIIISESIADKLGFGYLSADELINITLNGKKTTHRISGVYENMASNTSLKPQIILPYSYYLGIDEENATKKNKVQLNVILDIPSYNSIDLVNQKLTASIADPDGETQFKINLTPLEGIHLNGEYISGNGFLPGGNMQLIRFIVLTGILCLGISMINYANFNISLYISRTREIAIRKIIGSARSGVFQQLMTESFLTSIISMIIAILFFIVLVPHFSAFVGKEFSVITLLDSKIIPGIILLLIATATLSGVYPSVLLSRLAMLPALKGASKMGKAHFVVNGLLTLQFTISVTAIACMLTFKGQLNYLLSFDKGYNVDGIVEIDLPKNLSRSSQINAFVESLKQVPQIKSQATFSYFNMSSFDGHNGAPGFPLMHAPLNNEYIDLMGFEILLGMNLREAKESGISNAGIVNETFLKKSGITDPIGKKMDFSSLKKGSFTIVGVIKDHYLSNPKSEPKPILYYASDQIKYTYSIYLKTDLNNVQLSKKVEPLWDEVFSPVPMHYEYLTVSNKRKLDREIKIANIAQIGSGISIFLAGFGLLGLVGLTIKKRLRELSIRRILGARIRDIFLRTQRQFILPIMTSIIGGILISNRLANQWLEKYANRIEFGWVQYIVPVVIILSLLSIIVISQVWIVHKTNPVVHLKED